MYFLKHNTVLMLIVEDKIKCMPRNWCTPTGMGALTQVWVHYPRYKCTYPQVDHVSLTHPHYLEYDSIHPGKPDLWED